jgi:hypothetical protein
MHGLKHYQELTDMCQQDTISLSFRPAVFNSFFWPVFLIINGEYMPSKEAQSKITRPLLDLKKNQALLT